MTTTKQEPFDDAKAIATARAHLLINKDGEFGGIIGKTKHTADVYKHGWSNDATTTTTITQHTCDGHKFWYLRMPTPDHLIETVHRTKREAQQHLARFTGWLSNGKPFDMREVA